MTLEKQADLTAAARLSEIGLRWTMTQLFFLIHSGALSLVATQFKLGTAVFTGTCALGVVVGILWFVAARRAQYLVEFWNRKMAELELGQGSAVRVFQDEEPHGVPIYRVLVLLVSTFIAIWLTLLGYSSYWLLLLRGM